MIHASDAICWRVCAGRFLNQSSLTNPKCSLHVARDKRDIAAARAALVAELEGQGKTIVEDACYYADEEALYVSSANRADGEPATEDDANAYVIQHDWQGNHSAKPSITGWKDSSEPRSLGDKAPRIVAGSAPLAGTHPPIF